MFRCQLIPAQIVPILDFMSQNLSLVAWLGPTRHPPRSLLRALLVLVDLQDLRSYVSETLQSSAMESTTCDRIPYLFSREDEKCFFTYAQYVEPMTSIAVKIYDLQNAISLRILHTWGIRIQPMSLQLWFEDPQGQSPPFGPRNSLYQILGAYHPLWFCSRTFLLDLNISVSHLFVRLFFDFHAAHNDTSNRGKKCVLLLLQHVEFS